MFGPRLCNGSGGNVGFFVGGRRRGLEFFRFRFSGKRIAGRRAPGAGGTIANEFDSCQVECLYRAGPGVPRSPAPATVTAPERTEVRSVTKSTLQSHFRFALIHLKFACASSAAPPLAVDISATWSFLWLLTESIRHYGGAEHSGRHEFRGENFQVRAPSADAGAPRPRSKALIVGVASGGNEDKPVKSLSRLAPRAVSVTVPDYRPNGRFCSRGRGYERMTCSEALTGARPN